MNKRAVFNFFSPKVSIYFIGLMCFLPFIIYYHRLPSASFYAEWAAAALGSVAFFTLVAKSALDKVSMPQISLVFPGLAAIVMMQWMLGMLHSPQYAMLVLSYLVWGFCLVLLGSYLKQEIGLEKIATIVSWSLIAGSMVNVVIVSLQFMVKAGVSIPWMPTSFVYSAIGQVNHFADYCSLAVISVVYLYSKRAIAFRPFALVLVLLIAMLAFSGSRSVWLYLCVITILAVALQVNAIRQQVGSPNIRSALRVALVLIPLFALVQVIFHYILPNDLITLPTERLMDNTSGSSARWQIWQESWRLFMQSPWLGIGVGQMRWQSFLLLGNPGEFGTIPIFEHSHNIFVHLLTEFGVTAPLMLLVAVLAWLRGFKWKALSLETWWLIALLAVIGIHSMLEYPLWYAYFLGITAVLLGAGDEAHYKLKWIKTSRLMLALVAVLSVVNLSTMLKANVELEKWVKIANNKQITSQNITQFFDDLSWVQTNSLMAPYAELIYATAIHVDKNNLAQKVFISESAMRFMPMKRTTYQHVILLKLKGDELEAVHQLNRALIAYPGFLNTQIQNMPFHYVQDYLDVLSIARPIKQKNSLIE